jgi:hypothetical protein
MPPLAQAMPPGPRGTPRSHGSGGCAARGCHAAPKPPKRMVAPAASMGPGGSVRPKSIHLLRAVCRLQSAHTTPS